MSEFEDNPSMPAGAPTDLPVPADGSSERQRMLEAVMSDDAMPLAEKQARLDALAREWGLSTDAAEEEVASDPVRVQIANALALLAQGGHERAP